MNTENLATFGKLNKGDLFIPATLINDVERGATNSVSLFVKMPEEGKALQFSPPCPHSFADSDKVIKVRGFGLGRSTTKQK